MVETVIPKWNDLGEYEFINQLKRNKVWLENNKTKRYIKQDFNTIEELLILLFIKQVATYTPTGIIAISENRIRTVEGVYLVAKTYFENVTLNDVIFIKNNLVGLGLINNQYCPDVRKYTFYTNYNSTLDLNMCSSLEDLFKAYKNEFELLNLNKTI